MKFIPTISILAALHACSVASASAATTAPVEVIDGDTIEQDGATFRINGIDEPEKGQECRREDGGAWRR